MNNARVKPVLDETEQVDMKPLWISQEAEVGKILEALQNIKSSSYWSYLEKVLWSGVLGSLDRKLRIEKDEKIVANLQGQAVWAEKYADLGKLIEHYRSELSRIKNNLNQ